MARAAEMKVVMRFVRAMVWLDGRVSAAGADIGGEDDNNSKGSRWMRDALRKGDGIRNTLCSSDGVVLVGTNNLSSLFDAKNFKISKTDA